MTENQNITENSSVLNTQAIKLIATSQLINREVGKIYETFNYDQFKLLKGNRMVDPSHLHRLKKSVEEKQLNVPIIVNENYEVIDGQHRLEVFKQLGLPVKYIINEGYGIKEIQTLNTHMKNWKIDDFLKFYCDQGIKDYILYRDFRAKYGFKHQESLALLTNSTSNFSKLFNDGNFKIHSLEEAENAAHKISQFAEFYKGYQRKAFVFSILSLLKHPEYNHNEMIEKASMQRSELIDCPTIERNLALLEKIYNYHRKGKKVYFTKN